MGKYLNTESDQSVKGAGWFVKALLILTVCGSFLLILFAGGVYWHFARDLPQIINVADYRPLGVTRILAPGAGEKGERVEIGEFYKERRYLIPYEKIPEHVVRAFISAEDDRFFEHSGINIFSMVRASIANFKAGRVVQGGSTITQQVAKSLLLTPERSYDRKIKEIILASRIERNLSKQQILYLYLNQIYLGHGAYGAQAASRMYFGKDISNITLAEAALLAGMPQAPGKYSPLLNPKRAKERQLYVLHRMVENRFIGQQEMMQAAAEPLRIFHEDDINAKYAPYYVENIRKYLVEKYGEKAVYEDGLTVYVPVRPEVAEVAKKSVHEGLMAVDKRIGYRGPIQRLKTSDEIEKFLEVARIKLIEKRLKFQLFLPDGRLDQIEAMRNAGIQTDAELLEPGQFYQAVVTGFDNQKKTARVMIGAAKGELSLDKMRWARPARDEKNPNAARPEPSLPSRIFQKGDVVWVSVVKNSAEAPVILGPNEVAVALEQKPAVQGALISLDVMTGEVLSMVGGYDFEDSEFNRATQAMRQPGSAFKPIIYSSALEKGFNPASVIADSPIVFKDSEGATSWKPNNYEEKFYGDTTFRQALIKSRNIPTVKLVQAVTVPYLINYAKRLGMNSQFSADLSISLGSTSISLMDLTKIYSLFPRLGRKMNSVLVSRIEDRDGKVLEEVINNLLPSVDSIYANIKTLLAKENSELPPGAPKLSLPAFPLANDADQLLDPRVAYVMTHLMKEVVNFGTGREAKNLGRVAAGKTGTTNDSVDAWFVGFTPNVVTGVWVGFDNSKSIGPGETGAHAALPIWLNFMKTAVKTFPDIDFPVPPGIVFASIDANTGKLAAPNSSAAIKEAFVEGTQPTETSSSNSSSSESQTDFFKEDKE
ncbi:MAG: PBP1A family penicillin-binding protein [Bdellovibrionia bacterium]